LLSASRADEAPRAEREQPLRPAAGSERPRRRAGVGVWVAAVVLLAVSSIAAAQQGVLVRVLDYARRQAANVLVGAEREKAPSGRAGNRPASQGAAQLSSLERTTPVSSPQAHVQVPRTPSEPWIEVGDQAARPQRAQATRARAKEKSGKPTFVPTVRAEPVVAAPVVAAPVVAASVPSESAASLFAQAGALRARGQSQGASQLYRKLIEKFGASPEGHLSVALLARLELDQGDATAALRGFERYLASGDLALREQALAGRALALGRLGQRGAECAAFESLLRNYPDSAYASVSRQRCTTD